jgi:beta-N-acetylhexosaminidase
MSAGSVIVGGFSGCELPSPFRRALARNERAGAILFKRNIADDIAHVAALAAEIARALPSALIAIDQEGGRVARLGVPFVTLPAARVVAERGGIELVRRAASAQARELRALGFTLNFAPVLDIHSEPQNPIIGDRAFSSDPAHAARFGIACGLALQSAGILACGKHYPGHGDTTVDSHLALPTVSAPRRTLDVRELVPFRAAHELASLMTAHVVYPALDPERPATLSKKIATDLLRGELGYQGALFSDDLEMKAIHLDIESSAVMAIAAGCDLLLICSDEELQARAFDALTRESDKSLAFRTRLTEAARRSEALRARVPPSQSLAGDDLQRAFQTEEARAIEQALS